MRTTRRFGFVLLTIVASVVLACGMAVAATISGDANANNITGTAEIDSLFGYAGDDTISGGSAADRIFGGDGNDSLFGTDKDQTGVSDGNKTSADGNDRVEGEKGDDTVVGATGADTLRGGPGSDTIIEGPVNDAAQDIVEGDPTYYSSGPPPESVNWNDNINVFSQPASKDTVNCGPGTDTVQADPLDVVNANCENVEVMNPADVATPASSEPDPTTGEVPPLVVSSDDAPASPEDPLYNGGDVEPQTGGDSATTQAVLGITCYPPGYYRASVFCGKMYVPIGRYLAVGMNHTNPDQWVNFLGQRYGYRVGSTRLFDDYREFGTIYRNVNWSNGTTVYVYGYNDNRWNSIYYNGYFRTY